MKPMRAKRPKPKPRWRTMKAWGAFHPNGSLASFWNDDVEEYLAVFVARAHASNAVGFHARPVQIRWQERRKERK